MVLTATDTGAEIARLPLFGTCGSTLPQIAGDGEHLAEVVGPLDGGYQRTRVVDLGTGAAVEVVVPPGRFENVTEADPTLTVLTTPAGRRPCSSAAGRRCWRWARRPTRSTPWPTGGGPTPRRTAGRWWSICRNGVVVRDTASGEERGRLGSSFNVGDFSAIAVADEGADATRTADRWTITIYGCRPWRPRVLPGARAAADPDASLLFASASTTAWCPVDGLLSSGTGDPGTEPARPARRGDPGRATRLPSRRRAARPGRPDQVLIAAPDQPVLIYDLAERRIVAELPCRRPPARWSSTPPDRGLAVRTAQRTVELWDIDAGRRAAEPALRPRRVDPDRVQRRRLPRHDRARSTTPCSGGTSAAARSAERSSSHGRFADPRDRSTRCSSPAPDGMPGRLPLTAQVWAGRLCAVVGDYTDAERAALPAGTQDRRPCP